MTNFDSSDIVSDCSNHNAIDLLENTRVNPHG